MFDIDKIIENFKIYDFKTSEQILLKAQENKGFKKTLYIFAGPNGSGKSTLIANFYESGMLNNVKYINADIIAKTIFKDEQGEVEKNKKALFNAMKKMNDNAETGDSVVYETVLSHPSKIDIIKNYKDKGYEIVSIFISPNNPKINIERVLKRAQEGGHDVPQDKIIERFYRSHKLKQELIKLSDNFYEIDNTVVPTIKEIYFKILDKLNKEISEENDL